MGNLRIKEKTTAEWATDTHVYDDGYILRETNSGVWKFSDGINSYANINSDAWDDLRFPFIGRNLDSASGRIDYNYFNSAVGYQANARFPNEVVCSLVQLPHAWKVGSGVRPHIHWLQQSEDVPNWLLAYKIGKKNSTNAIETDFSNYTLLLSSPVFTYTSGVFNQISDFPEIDMTGVGISDLISIAVFRDVGNVSTLFAGADPSSLVEYINELDIHYILDSKGSSQEFIK